MEVLVEDHDLGLRGAEIAPEIERQIEKRSLEGTSEAIPGGRDALFPPGGNIGQESKRMVCDRCAPDPAKDLRRDLVRALLVSLAPELGAGNTLLNE